MKTINLLFAATAAFALTSCGGSEAPVEDTVDEVVIKSMSLDTDASTLSWKGMKSAEDFHTGNVKFSEGSAEFVDGNFMKGTFVVDMSTITVMDAEMPDDKKQYLAGHLSSPDFFNVEEHGAVQVELSQIQDGKAPATITIMGQSMEQNLPISVEMKDGVAHMTGSFDVDFSALGRPGFQPKEGQEEFVQPIISYELNMMLK